MRKGWFKRIVLWSGLLLCVYALWRAHELAGGGVAHVSLTGWCSVGLLLGSSWLFAVLSWRQYLFAYTGHDFGWRVAMRQLGLLLIGKYVPGGVFGFLARLYDQKETFSRRHLLWAGLVEQALGIAISISVGAGLYLVAARENIAWSFPVVLLPLIAIAGLWALHRLPATWLHWAHKYVTPTPPLIWQRLLIAWTMQLLQQLSWAAIVILLGYELYGLSGYIAIGVGGAFLLAVATGMLAIFAPGGIGVREAALVGLASHWIGVEQAIFMTALLRLLNGVVDAAAGAVSALLAENVNEPKDRKV